MAAYGCDVLAGSQGDVSVVRERMKLNAEGVVCSGSFRALVQAGGTGK